MVSNSHTKRWVMMAALVLGPGAALAAEHGLQVPPVYLVEPAAAAEAGAAAAPASADTGALMSPQTPQGAKDPDVALGAGAEQVVRYQPSVPAAADTK